MQTIRFLPIVVAVIAATGGGCKLLDDDEPPPIDMTGGGTGDDSCVALVEAACDPGMNVVMNYSVGGGKAALIDDPLATCDDTRFSQRSDGYFEISRLSLHGLLAAMGLERGDVITAVDGAPMNDLDTVMAVASRISTASSFMITVSRDGEEIVTHVVAR